MQYKKTIDKIHYLNRNALQRIPTMKKYVFNFLVLLLLIINNGFAQTDANASINGITIYIDYPDATVAVTAIQLDSLLNGVTYSEPGVDRTFRAYWHQQTRRNIDLTHDIFFYTAPEPVAYYEALPWYEGILLWQDALEHVISAYPDYNWDVLSLHEDGDPGPIGALRSVMIISSAFGPAGVGAAHGANWTLSNGEYIGRIYGSVLQAPWDVDNNIFMTLHEAGHAVFGFPDTYDTEYDSGGNWFYTLMSGGKPDVEPIGGPFLVEYNWGHILEPGAGTTTTFTLRADSDSVIAIRNPHDPLEYFTLEARNNSHIGNSLFPVPLGLLIWHTDSKVNSSNRQEDMTPLMHYRHSIEQADGLFELEGGLDPGGYEGDIFLPGDSFTPTSTPNSNWWSGENSGVEIIAIELIGSNHIQVTVTIPEIHTDHYPEIPTADWTLISATPPQTGYEGDKAFDGNLDTYYHVPWGNTEPRSHDLIIDLNEMYTLNEFYYTANDNYSPPWEGRIENYELYISEDGADWGTPIAAGTFFRTKIRQYVLFPEVSGRYIKFAAVNSFDDDVRTSVAEINLRGYPTAEAVVDEEIQKSITLYPNPVQNLLFLHTYTKEILSLEIYSMNGDLIRSDQNITYQAIDVSDYSRGTYLVKINTATEPEVFRFTKY
ncbi:MAG: M6 family metalloprotease-like protein [Crocinitomix sp.]|jgi:M6 family metalloprotease-like protein